MAGEQPPGRARVAAALGERFADDEEELFAIEGLEDEVGGAALHRFDGERDGAVRGEHEHGRAGEAARDVIEELHAIELRHA